MRLILPNTCSSRQNLTLKNHDTIFLKPIIRRQRKSKYSSPVLIIMPHNVINCWLIMHFFLFLIWGIKVFFSSFFCWDPFGLGPPCTNSITQYNMYEFVCVPIAKFEGFCACIGWYVEYLIAKALFYTWVFCEHMHTIEQIGLFMDIFHLRANVIWRCICMYRVLCVVYD